MADGDDDAALPTDAPAASPKPSWFRRPRDERVMEAVLSLRRGHTAHAHSHRRSAPVSMAQIESQLLRRAEEAKRAAEAQGRRVTDAERAGWRDVSWARDAVERLTAQRALANVNAGLPNVAAMYKVTDAALSQIEAILMERRGDATIPTEAKRRENKQKQVRKRRNKAKSAAGAKAGKRLMREANKIRRLHEKHNASQRRSLAKHRK